MPEKEYPYETRLNILHEPLELIDIPALVEKCTDEWFNQTLCKVNNSVVRVGILHGEYHWHKHHRDDECFFTLEGKLIVDVKGRESKVRESKGQVSKDWESIELLPQQGYVVPKGVVHRTRAPEKSVILMIETAGIIPTGDE